MVIPSSSVAVLPAEAANVPKTTPLPEVKVNCSRAVVKKNLKLDGIETLNSPIKGNTE